MVGRGGIIPPGGNKPGPDGFERRNEFRQGGGAGPPQPAPRGGGWLCPVAAAAATIRADLGSGESDRHPRQSQAICTDPA